MNEQLVALKLIKDNPYQGRQVYEDIDVLGRSIATDDLQEIPKARKVKEAFQIKFGHRRREAFKWLQENWKKEGLTDRYNGYTIMPLDIEEVTDEEMYRGAVIENEHRKNLSPIEQAQMMLVYRDQFKKSSEDIGTLFGKDGATVRGLIRLLDLPQEVQDKVATGEITQSSARKLLTIARIDESKVLEAAKEIVSGEDPDDVIENSIKNNENTVTMWESWRHDKPRAGSDLWLLDTPADKFPSKHFPELKPADIAKAVGMEFTAAARTKIEDYITATQNNPEYMAELAAKTEDPTDAALIERIGHLLKPPSCAGCPFHATVDRSHYCGFKACHKHKSKAWMNAEIHRVSKRLGLPIYDPTVDGKNFVPACEYSYQDEYKKHALMVEAKDTRLRLAVHKSDYRLHAFTDSNFVRVIFVGDLVSKAKKDKEKAHIREQAKVDSQQRIWELEHIRREASRKFYYEQVPQHFAVAFSKLDHIAAMNALVSDRKQAKPGAKKAEVLATLRMALADQALNQDLTNYQITEKGPVFIAKRVQKIAVEWGVKLPKDFLDIAKTYEPAVAAEDKKK
jgi:ParB-like chromosome segregation protein Spo0J